MPVTNSPTSINGAAMTSSPAEWKGPLLRNKPSVRVSKIKNPTE